MTSPETWALCVGVLMGIGHKELHARGIIGQQFGEYTEADVVNAYTLAAGKVDPVRYAKGVLARCKKKGRQVQDRLKLDEPAPASREKAKATIAHARAILRGREPGED